MTTGSSEPAERRAPPGGLRDRLVTAGSRAAVRMLLRPVLDPRVSPRMQRAWTERLAMINRIASGTELVPVDMGGVPGIRIQPATGTGRLAVLYLHGGGYVIGSARAEAVIPAFLARGAGATVYTADYRLAPEHRFPAALEDTRAAYEWLLGRGADPARVAFVGDSAGSGLVLAEAMRARDAGDPLPGALGLISPWLDLTLSGESMRSNASSEPTLTRDWLAECARLYLDGTPADDPSASPLFADLHGLPPTLVQAAGDDILLSDAEGITERLVAAGVDASLTVYEGLWHDFHLHAGVMRPADRAIEELAEFLGGRAGRET